MEESLKATRLIYQLVVAISAALIAFGFSAEEPTNDYDKALSEFRLIQPTLDQIGELEIQQTTDYYQRQGVLAIFSEEFNHLDTSRLRVIGVQGRFGRPFYGAGDKAPIADLHRYLVMMERWETFPVWEVDMASLREGLKKYHQIHSDLAAVSNIYISAERPEGWNGEAESYDPHLLSVAAHF